MSRVTSDIKFRSKEMHHITKKKILLLSPFENEATGRGDRNLKLEDELVNRGFEVTFVTSNFDHSRKSAIKPDAFTVRAGLNIIKVPGYKKNVSLQRLLTHIVFSFKTWRKFRHVSWDAIVVSTVPPECLIAARLLRKKALILDVRDIWPDALLAYGKTSIVTKIFKIYCDLIYQLTVRRADRIMIVAPGYRAWLKRYTKLSFGKVKFVPLGFRREDFQARSAGGEKWEYCYAGGLTPQFDITELSSKFGRKRGIILGSGPSIDKWKQSLPGAKFLGTVTRREAMSIMSQAKALLFPSNPYAQLPNKAFDYFALGYPVEFGHNCSRASRYLLTMRQKNILNQDADWKR